MELYNCSRSRVMVIETVNSGLCVAWINYSGYNPPNSYASGPSM